ncbi:MAG: hypothetical protein AAFY71_20860 [Bacteroidota bacterium]
MKKVCQIVLLCFIWTACEQVNSFPPQEEEELDTQFTSSSCLSPLCTPVIGTKDTSCVRMNMMRNGNFYEPSYNWICSIPNIFLNINQFWINGGTNGRLVVSLIFPDDITVGSYPLLASTEYIGIFSPTPNGSTFEATSGTLNITVHDTVNHLLEGGFDFVAEDLSSPVTPDEVFTKGCFVAHY